MIRSRIFLDIRTLDKFSADQPPWSLCILQAWVSSLPFKFVKLEIQFQPLIFCFSCSVDDCCLQPRPLTETKHDIQILQREDKEIA